MNLGEALNMKLIFAGVYFAGIIAEIIIRAPYNKQRQKIAKTDQRVSTAEKLLLTLFFVGMFALPAVYAFTPWLDFANYNLSQEMSVMLGISGTVVFIAALWVFWRAHRDLGSNWSPSLEINAEQTLVTQGIYGVVRHPMYASQFLWCIAQALLLQNWIAGLAGIVCFLPLYLMRVPREEQMMLDHFGAQYRDYLARTGRVVPKLRG
jgi:protein-S-isoprenylcysteine O-methyltransferase Ste14